MSMNMKNKLEQREVINVVAEFIKENYLYWSEDFDLGDDHSLMEGGILDSTGILELAAFLESRFEISIRDEEFVPENLDTLNAISSYVLRKTNGHISD
jgi:acyl carrier protein